MSAPYFDTKKAAELGKAARANFDDWQKNMTEDARIELEKKKEFAKKLHEARTRSTSKMLQR